MKTNHPSRPPLLLLLLMISTFDFHVIQAQRCIIDLNFLVDSSGSINYQTWALALKFVANIVRVLTIGPDDVRVAFVVFASNVTVEWGLAQYQDKASLVHAIDNVRIRGGNTNLNGALYLTWSQVYREARPNANKVTIILTDGVDNEPEFSTPLTIQNASRCKNDGIRLIAVGVTNSTDEQRLMQIASSQSDFYPVGDFNALNSIISKLTSQNCITPEASHTTYVYSVGPSLVSVDVDIDDRHADDIRASPRVVLSDRGRIQALATHVDQALVYFSDTRTGAIYRTTRYEWDVAELTVQQPHVEGLAVHWKDEILFWSDMILGHIMYSQLDGRYHAILLTGLVKPKALAVDPVDGMLYWSVGGSAARYIHRTTLDGAAADNVKRFIDVTDNSVSTAAEAAVQDIVVDVTTRSLYWSDPVGGTISSYNLVTRQKRRVTFVSYSAPLYGVTVFQNYVTYTNGPRQLQFVVDAVGGVRKLDVKFSNSVSGLPASSASYGVVLLDKYLQPNVSSGCKSAHGRQCQHHCISGQRTSRCSCAIGFTLSDDQRTCDTNLVRESFLLFTDPYHKQVYQLPTSDDLPVVRGVAMPTDAQVPISVDVFADEGLVYWIDSSARHVLSTKFSAAEHSIIANLPQGSRAVRLAFSEVSRRLFFTDWERGSINVIDVQQSDTTPQPLITGLNNPLPITTRPQHRTIYWAEAGVIKSSLDDGSDVRILADNLGNITAIDISQDDIMYAVDILDHRILAINLNTSSVTVVYRTRDDRRPYTLAVGQQYIYFSAWNRKGIYRLGRHNSTEAEMIGEAVFARITDLKYIEKMGVPVQPSTTGLSLALIIGLAALGLLLLLLILIPLIVVARRRRRRSKYNETPEPSLATTTTTMESGGSSWEDDVPLRRSPPVSRPIVSVDDIKNVKLSGISSAQWSGSKPLPTPPAPAYNGQPPRLPQRSSYGMVHRNTGSRPPAPPPGSDSTAHGPQVDPLPGLGPERPQGRGPTGSYVFSPPRPYSQPRGWAPASHNVPIHVKRTWGRAGGAKQVAQR